MTNILTSFLRNHPAIIRTARRRLVRGAVLWGAVFAITSSAAANSRVRGLHIYGGSDETHLPIMLLPSPESYEGAYAGKGDKSITIDFDVDAPLQPVLTMLFVHCFRDWTEDQNYNDQFFMHLTTQEVSGKRADPRIRQYGYHYSLHYPNVKKNIIFDYSGNYKVKIIDGDDTLAVGRFYVADQLASMQVQIYNEENRATETGTNVHNVLVNATCAPEIFQTSLEGVDLLQNHRVDEPFHIDQTDTTGNSSITVSGTYITFEEMNIIPGNTYRTIDLTDPGTFAPSTTPQAFYPVDIIRAGLSDIPDNGGAEILNATPATYADYLPIAFRLDAGGKQDFDIFIVGEFNGWLPGAKYRMQYSEKENCYTCIVWLKRGKYDYQYVTGWLDEKTGAVTHQSWTALEGNSWGAPRKYTALLYYHDNVYNGIDRIIATSHN